MCWLLIYFTIFHSLTHLKEWWITNCLWSINWGQEVQICDTGIAKEQSSPTHNIPWWVKWRGKNKWNPSLSPRVKSPWTPSAFIRASSPMGSIPTQYSRHHDQKTTYHALGTDNTVSMRAPYSPTPSTWTKNKPQIWWRTILDCFLTTEIGLLSSQQGKAAKVDLKEFVNELIGCVDALVLTSPPRSKRSLLSPSPKQIKSRGMLKKISNPVKWTSNLSLCC